MTVDELQQVVMSMADDTLHALDVGGRIDTAATGNRLMECFDSLGNKDGRSRLEFSTGDAISVGAITDEALDQIADRLDVTLNEDSRNPGVTEPAYRLVRFAENRSGIRLSVAIRLDADGAATMTIGTACSTVSRTTGSSDG